MIFIAVQRILCVCFFAFKRNVNASQQTTLAQKRNKENWSETIPLGQIELVYRMDFMNYFVCQSGHAPREETQNASQFVLAIRRSIWNSNGTHSSIVMYTLRHTMAHYLSRIHHSIVFSFRFIEYIIVSQYGLSRDAIEDAPFGVCTLYALWMMYASPERDRLNAHSMETNKYLNK